ncbi:DUF996 domain-containing protein [Vulcanisaeta souniana]|nr:DUF996 domain-containing protein [Vulcanisaeta souniana]
MSSQEDIRSAGTIGFIGGILALIPYIDFVGLIMVLIALYKLSHDYGNEGIWRNAIYAVVFSIIGVAIATFTLVGSLSLLSSISYSTIGAVTSIIVFFIVFYIFMVISGYFWRNAYAELGRSSGMNEFNNASRWYWLGALLTIILVGAILTLIADIYAIIGYHKLSQVK